jgi:hypothetical protein
VKTRGRLLKHAGRYWLFLAESHLTRPLFGVHAGEIAVCRHRLVRQCVARRDFDHDSGKQVDECVRTALKIPVSL